MGLMGVILLYYWQPFSGDATNGQRILIELDVSIEIDIEKFQNNDFIIGKK